MSGNDRIRQRARSVPRPATGFNAHRLIAPVDQTSPSVIAATMFNSLVSLAPPHSGDPPLVAMPDAPAAHDQ